MKEKILKPLVTLLVSLVMMLSVVPATFAEDADVATQASTALNISLSSTDEGKALKPGDTFQVVISASADSNLGAFDYVLFYDKNEVTPTGISKGAAYKAWNERVEDESGGATEITYAGNFTETPGEVNISAACAIGFTESGEFFIVKFKVNDDSVTGNAGITQLVKNAGQPKGITDPVETTPSIGTEDKSFEEKIEVKPEFKSAKMSALPKTSYTKGDTFSVEGGKVEFTYTNNATKTYDLTAAMCSDTDTTTVGKHTVNVEVKAEGQILPDAFTYEVSEKRAVKATLTPPTKLTYIQDEADTLDLTGAKWNVEFNDGSTDSDYPVKPEDCSDYDLSTTGKQTVTVKSPVEGETSTFEITVAEKQVTKVEWETEPTKLAYIVGKDTALDVTGGKVKVSWNNNKNASVDLDADWCTGFNAAPTALGAQTITVTYPGTTEMGLTYDINWDKEAKSIKVTTPPTKVDYVEGQTFDPAGGMVTVTYTDNSTDTVALDKCTVDVDTKEVGTAQNAKVTYQNISASGDATFNINVVAKKITEATFTAPKKTEYIEGAATALDVAEGKWHAVYNDADEKDFDLTTEMCDATSYDLSKPGNYTVKVTLPGWDTPATFPITVKAKSVEAIALTAPTKVNYVVGKDTALDVTGGKLKVSYDNGTEATIDLTQDMCSAISDWTVTGEQTVTVTYEGKTAEFKITLKKALDSIAMKAGAEPKIVSFVQNAPFDVDGEIVATYSDKETKDFDIAVAMCSAYDMNKAGKQMVTVTLTQEETAEYYAGTQTTSYEIFVTGIEVKTNPTKTTYTKGEGFNGAGLTASFITAGEATTTIDWASGLLSVEGYDANVTGAQKLTLVYTAEDGTKYRLTDAIEITVMDPEAPAPTTTVTPAGTSTNSGTGTSNPSTGTNAGSIALIVGALVLAAAGVKAYQVKKRV